MGVFFLAYFTLHYPVNKSPIKANKVVVEDLAEEWRKCEKEIFSPVFWKILSRDFQAHKIHTKNLAKFK